MSDFLFKEEHKKICCRQRRDEALQIVNINPDEDDVNLR